VSESCCHSEQDRQDIKDISLMYLGLPHVCKCTCVNWVTNYFSHSLSLSLSLSLSHTHRVSLTHTDTQSLSYTHTDTQSLSYTHIHTHTHTHTQTHTLNKNVMFWMRDDQTGWIKSEITNCVGTHCEGRGRREGEM